MIDNLVKIISEAEIFQIVLFLVLLTLIFIQIILKIIFLLKILLYKNPGLVEQKKPVSILMAVRNEGENLTKNLPQLLEFENVNYEVVVVDDFSQDNTLSVLGKFKDANPKLKVSSLNQETRFSSKLSQNIALKSAINEWVLFLPPSARQFQKGWLEKISQSISGDFDAVINYFNVLANRKFYNKLYRIETFLLYLKSMSFILSGVPIVYFEDNVAFRKTKYFELGGYGKKINEPYANLELLINKFLLKNKCQINLSDETSVRFSGDVNRQDFFDLIKKSFRIEQHMSNYRRILLFANSVFRNLILPLAIVVFVFYTGVWPIILFILSLLGILHLFIIKTVQNHLNERKIFISSLIYELIMPWFKVVFRWHFNRRSRNPKWKSKI